MKPNAPPDNPLVNLLVNILAPVVILNKGSHYLDPRYALLLALCLPLGYGIQDYVRRGHKNYVSLIGLVNIGLTGTLAVLELHGTWFAVKEASLPLVLGLLTLGSAFSRSPAARMMFCNPQVLNMDLIDERVRERNQAAGFAALLKQTTLWLSVSFFISSILNFVLALRIFLDIDPALDVAQRDQILNEQIARMTWMGFAVIALPLMVFSGILIYAFLRKLAALTAEPIEKLMKS